MKPGFPELADARFPDVLNVVYLRRVDSTNRLARHILDEYLREDLGTTEVLVIALEQEEGRGRQGRTWASPFGEGLYATLLLREVERLDLLPILLPLALCRALNRRLDGRCRIKWPNDLMLAGDKLGGLLIEVPRRGAESRTAILGFGINLGNGIGILSGATSLDAELGEKAPTLGQLATELVAEVMRTVKSESDPAASLVAYRDLLIHEEGDELTCRIGGELVQGHFEGLDENGRLGLRVDGELRYLSAAEIFS